LYDKYNKCQTRGEQRESEKELKEAEEAKRQFDYNLQIDMESGLVAEEDINRRIEREGPAIEQAIKAAEFDYTNVTNMLNGTKSVERYMSSAEKFKRYIHLMPKLDPRKIAEMQEAKRMINDNTQGISDAIAAEGSDVEIQVPQLNYGGKKIATNYAADYKAKLPKARQAASHASNAPQPYSSASQQFPIHNLPKSAATKSAMVATPPHYANYSATNY
jgi:hypothetical protein